MIVQSERLPGSLARLEIKLDQARVDREIDRAYKRLANRVVIPGFRRGKAPRVLVERSLGEGGLLQEAIQELVPEAISDALQQENLQVAGEPESYNQLGTEPFRFEVTVPLVPTVTLGDYKAVRAERQPIEVTDEEVDEVIERLRERETTWMTPAPSRPAQMGDQIVMDIQDFIENESPSEVQEDYTVVLGEGELLPELEGQLIGAEEGGDYEYSVTLPEDHPDEEAAGKPARFKVHVKSVKEKVQPELDDDFARRVGEDVQTMDELRTRVRENLEARKASEERERLVDDVLSKMVETSTVEMPDVLVEREVDHRIEHLESEMRSSGLTLDQYLQFTNRSREDLRSELIEPSRERLQRGLVLSEIARAEGIEVSEEELQRERSRLMRGIDESELDNVRQILDSDEWRNRMRSDAYDRKVLNHVVQIATGEPLDAVTSEAEDEPVQESDVEILDAISEIDDDQTPDGAVAQAPEEAAAGVAPAAPEAGAEQTAGEQQSA